MGKGLKDKRIAVLMGGLSKEREISLKSGRAVAQALRKRGYQVTEIDAGRDLAVRLLEQKTEIAVVMLHGRWGEDGTIQGMLEILGIPYTGSGPLASAVGIDKDLTKRLVSSEGILTPKWRSLHRDEITTLSRSPLPLPVIVKPNLEGSTLGATVVREEKELRRALGEAASYGDRILVEEFIEGRELTVGLIDGKSLPVLEVVPKSGFYDFKAKYTPGMTEYIVPARIPDEVGRQVSDISEKVFRLLKLEGVARADFIWREESYFLEINTIPGMTELSLVPKAAGAAGIGFEDLCEKMVEGASLKI